MYVVLVVYTSGDIYIYECISLSLVIYIQSKEHILSMYVGLAVYRVLYISKEHILSMYVGLAVYRVLYIHQDTYVFYQCMLFWLW